MRADVELGNRLRLLREAHGLTQRELATRAGIAQPTLTHIERGHAEPRIETIRFLAEALGTTESALTSDVFFAVELLSVLGIPVRDVAAAQGVEVVRSAEAPAAVPGTDAIALARQLAALPSDKLEALSHLVAALGPPGVPPPQSAPSRTGTVADEGGSEGRGGRHR